MTISTGGALTTLNKGVRAVPSLSQGIGLTIFLALIGSSGRVVVPVVIQIAIDHGLQRATSSNPQDVDVALVIKLCMGAAT